MWCRLGWLALLAVLWLTGGYARAEGLEQQLQQWQTKGSAARFQGSYVYERNDTFSTHTVWQRTQNDGRVHTRFLRMNGPELEVLRINGELVCASRMDEADQQHSSLLEPSLNLERLQQGYGIRAGGTSRVAGRKAQAVLFVPADVHRYPLEVHFDWETGVILKALLLSEDGELLERFQYVWFSSADFASERLSSSAGCVAVPSNQELTRATADNWQLNWLPPGFVPTVPVQELAGASSRSYGDGLASFSVFVSPLDGGRHEASYQQLGPVAIVSRPVRSSAGDYMITVLGEVPPATAQRLLLSVALRENQDD